MPSRPHRPRPRRAGRSALLCLALALALPLLAACSGTSSADDKTFAIATFFPTSGADALLGQSLQNAVDLAAKQNANLGSGYTLTVDHLDAAGSDAASAAATFAADPAVMGVVGPLDSDAALKMAPIAAQNGLTTISPSATLPGLTQADQAQAEGVSFDQLHPKGKPVAFFRLPETDNALGKAAADLATASSQSHGLGAQSVFLVDDGSASAKALASAFAQELKARHGGVAGQQSVAAGVPDSAQSAVTAIIKADPDIVFYAGDMAAGAELRATLSLTGAPQLTILTAGPSADHPAWASTVGVTPAAAYTIGILPARDLSTLPGAKDFIAAYQSAFQGAAPLPQAALAYDAAMDEIAAIRSLVKAGQPVTRAAILAAVASAKYSGVTGTIAFDKNGDNAAPIGFSVYTCDTKGTWQYQTPLNG